MNKEKVFVSAVVYVDDLPDAVTPFFSMLYAELDEHFDSFEMIAIDDGCSQECTKRLRELSADFDKPLTILHFDKPNGREAAMNAGLDAAIGDYVYQFESICEKFPQEYIFRAFEAMGGSCDIVNVCPDKQRLRSRMFYALLNRSSNRNAPLSTELFSIVTRRAINRVHSISHYLPYRKIAFAESGLSAKRLLCPTDKPMLKKGNSALAVESLLLYTQTGYRISIAVAVIMALITLLELIYGIVVFCLGSPIEGWTTMTFFITFGFTGLFLIMTIVIKYLSLILGIVFRNRQYLISSIEKLQK